MTDTDKITEAAEDLSDCLSEGGDAARTLGQEIANAIKSIDARLDALEEGTDIDPPVEPPIEPPTGGTGPSGDTNAIPLTFNDPIFTNMTEKTSKMSLSSGQNLDKVSIKEQSGDPSITCNGNNRLTKVRVISRECVRITRSTLTIEDAYLESKGVGDDHADTLQAYSPGARGGVVTLRNTHVRAFANQSVGYFTADNWGGTIVHNNVIYQSGVYGLRAISDPSCHIDIDMENVFFVGPFTYGRFAFQEYNGGTLTIRKWINVRDATISNGKLVPGNIINKPTSAEMSQMSKDNRSPRPKPPTRKDAM